MPLPDRIPAGRPWPLGATLTEDGVNFALFSAHAERVELCLFDAEGRQEVARRDLPARTDQVWHGFLPGAGAGTVYGFRVHGPYAPLDGHRFNPNKLLLDPYARGLAGGFRWDDSVHGYTRGDPAADLSFDPRDSAPFVPKSVVVDPAHDWEGDEAPRTPWADTVIYEAHVRGLTMRHPGVPEPLRGTLGGLAHPVMVDHLRRLGVTAVELMPVHAFLDERALVERGLRNYWGYNTAAFFAVHPAYAGALPPLEALRNAVKALHRAGIEVILDVVYNHTAESDVFGPTLNFRGIDNLSYYQHAPHDRREPFNPTGTGNALDLGHPRVLQMVMDSLRWWVEAAHVGGSRFALAPTLARVDGEFTPAAPFLQAVAQDPVLAPCKLIAEPWDIGPGGWRVGEFPAGWSGWNDRYRGGVRRTWRRDPGQRPELARRLSASADLFDHGGRGARASVNFVTAHDGFTLADLASYARKHNEANGEGNRDGTGDNHSDNLGAEGPTDDPAILARRLRRRRNLLATLLFSQGVPMLLGGDELGHSQQGNNNAYCQDGTLTWLDWDAADPGFLDFAARVVALRRAHPALRQPQFLHGAPNGKDGLPDIAWLRPDGEAMAPADWDDPAGFALGVLLSEPGTPPLLLLLNPGPADIPFALPSLGAWHPWLDTARTPAVPRLDAATYPLMAESLALLALGAASPAEIKNDLQ
ncbi:glycogen debranching protein GlgX [Inquilinus sp. Marseille-Q2685]|uniref:glycogen debranching protein GlgX n=1 Tax=Inquilinus sp. Marseille-Q2685 TaxID=2866581 RepID=UPI001CE4793D|nr:glycogen debranching protein GlgX [Inquilinus sp. Marseille-Q2685]